MSTQLVNQYVIQYSTNIELLSQQKGSRLAMSVRTGNHQGKQASPVNQFGALNAQRVTGRLEPKSRTDAPADRRWVFPADYDLSQYVDSFDKLRLFTDPGSAQVENGTNAMARAKDDEIIAAFFADAKTGESGGTTVTFGITLTTSAGGLNVSVNTGGTASGLNVAKLREGKKSLGAAEVDLENDPLYFVAKMAQLDNLLGEAQVTSADFNQPDRPVLQEGMITRFLGINFLRSERLTTGTDDASGTSTQCALYAKSGMYLGTWNESSPSMNQRRDLRGEPWEVYHMMTLGATRLEEVKMRRVWCR